MSVVWWRSLHQEATVLRPGAPTMAGSMLATLLFATVAFSIAYAYLMAVRTRVGRIEDRVAGTLLTTTAPRARVPRRSVPLASRPSGGESGAAPCPVPSPDPSP